MKKKLKKFSDGWNVVEDSGVFIVREQLSPYGWKYVQFQCPVCKTWHYKTAKYIHITSKAKRESLEKHTTPDIKTPHLDFYLKNTETKEVRVWKGDSRIIK